MLRHNISSSSSITYPQYDSIGALLLLGQLPQLINNTSTLIYIYIWGPHVSSFFYLYVLIWLHMLLLFLSCCDRFDHARPSSFPTTGLAVGPPSPRTTSSPWQTQPLDLLPRARPLPLQQARPPDLLRSPPTPLPRTRLGPCCVGYVAVLGLDSTARIYRQGTHGGKWPRLCSAQMW